MKLDATIESPNRLILDLPVELPAGAKVAVDITPYLTSDNHELQEAGGTFFRKSLC